MLLRRILAFLLLGVGLFLGWIFRLQNLAVAVVAPAIGRSGVCSYSQSFRTYGDFLDFQAVRGKIREASSVQREEGVLRLWKTPEGDFWSPKATDLVFVLTEQVREFYGTGDRAVQSGDVVLDAGANVGTFTRTALRRGARLVVAIEPVPNNVESLRRTFAQEIAAGRVIVYPKGVWNKDDTLTMRVYPNSALDTFVMTSRTETRDKPKELQLPLTTIDKLVGELALDRVDYIKMDIEGAERKALEGAAATIRRWSPRMSIATENLSDDQYVVPEVVRSILPAYRHEFGSCSVADFEVRPDVLFFRVPGVPTAGR